MVFDAFRLSRISMVRISISWEELSNVLMLHQYNEFIAYALPIIHG